MSPDAATSFNAPLWRKEPDRNRCNYAKGSYFEWIEATRDPKFEEIRSRIESLWRRIPHQHRADYTARLRSNRESDFLSCYNELWFHHALEAGGLRCGPAQATASGSLPDWHLTVDGTPIAVAECYLRMRPEQERRNDSVQQTWFDSTFKKLKHHGIRLWIHKRTCGPGQPSAHRLASRLNDLVKASTIEGGHESVQTLGRHQYEDDASGWSLDFTLMIRNSIAPDSMAQLLAVQSEEVYWCQGEKLFEEALSRKSSQHSARLPVAVCVGWNYFAQEPSLDEVCRVVASKVTSFEARGVCGVFWSREVYPWNAAPPAPQLIHWRSPLGSALLSAWQGNAIDVSDGEGI